jgi:hypothetical protein
MREDSTEGESRAVGRIGGGRGGFLYDRPVSILTHVVEETRVYGDALAGCR